MKRKRPGKKIFPNPEITKKDRLQSLPGKHFYRPGTSLLLHIRKKVLPFMQR